MKKTKRFLEYINEDNNNYDEVEYYDYVGEHGGFQVKNGREAFIKAIEIINDENFDPKETGYVGTHQIYNGQESGTILWATQEYLDIVMYLDCPEVFLDALREFISTKKPINWHIEE